MSIKMTMDLSLFYCLPCIKLKEMCYTIRHYKILCNWWKGRVFSLIQCAFYSVIFKTKHKVIGSSDYYILTLLPRKQKFLNHLLIIEMYKTYLYLLWNWDPPLQYFYIIKMTSENKTSKNVLHFTYTVIILSLSSEVIPMKFRTF